MISRYKKAISPLIATIILIAVTIAIAVIVVAWIYGIFGSISGPTEKLQIFQDARLVNWTSQKIATFNVTVKNIGSSAIVISKVYIKEQVSCQGSLDNVPSSNNPLSPGSVTTLGVSFSSSGGCNIMPGVTYTVIIVTTGGQAYSVPVTAEQG